MVNPARVVGEMFAYAATRKNHDCHDHEVVNELTLASTVSGGTELGLPEGVELRWLGVAGFALTAEGTTILIDPYATRISKGDILWSKVIEPDRLLIDRWIPKADAILIGHTHFDHAFDVPVIARRDNCGVFGGTSAAQLMGLYGLGNLSMEVEAHRTYEVGPFEITFVPSQHSKLLAGVAVPSGGEITCEHVGELTTQKYRCGQVWGIRIAVGGAVIYHQGSADLHDDEIERESVDVFLCGIAGRQVTERYLERICRRLDPATVMLCHHDDFLLPLDGPQGFAFGVDVSGFVDELSAVSASARLVAPHAPLPTVDG